MGKRTKGDFPRRKNDSYDTPESAISPLLPHIESSIRFVEPCAGKGNLVDFLEKNGHHCVGKYDVDPRRGDIVENDVLDMHPHQLIGCDYIITNPPWTRKLLHPMIEMFCSIRPTWLLFDANWMHTKQAAPYLPYCKKVVTIGRVSWMENGTSGVDDSCWYLFDSEKGRGPLFLGRGMV